MPRLPLLLALASALVLALAPLPAGAERDDPGPITRIETADDIVEEVPARAGGDRVHVLVEIPAGTDAKWEASADGGEIAWEREEGGLRVVRYLPYPGSYGLVPRTRQPAAEGGDGDPLDVLVLGPALARGAVVEARPVAVLRLRDDGERDDKILAVLPGTPLGDVRDLPELEERFPGVTTIVETWFRHYKGPGRIEVRGLEGADAAWATVEEAAAAWEREED